MGVIDKFSHILDREKCVDDRGVKLKDLRIIRNRNLSSMLIIDNQAISFALHLANGILIKSFYNDFHDQSLPELNL